MVRYTLNPSRDSDGKKVWANGADLKANARARGTYVRVHYKHTREIFHTIRGWHVDKAMTFLTNVLAHKAAVPITRHKGGVGRHAQAKLLKAPGDQANWPEKATKVIYDMLVNVKSNAVANEEMDVDNLYINHAVAQWAPKGRRRTYRAHGRVNAYMSCPAHLELICGPKPEAVEKAAPKEYVSKKSLAKKRVRVGGGI